jgi:hypothetical protein
MIVEAGHDFFTLLVKDWIGAQVDFGRDKLFNYSTKYISFQHGRDFIPKFKFKKDFLNIRREAVKIGVEIGSEFCLSGTGGKVAEIEERRITKGLTGSRTESGGLIGNFIFVEVLLHFKNLLLGGFKDSVKTADYCHWEYDITVLPPDIYIPKAVIGYTPDEIDDLVVNHGVHKGNYIINKRKNL